MAEKEIKDIIRNKTILEKLTNAGINTLEELCSYSQKRLNEKGIEQLYVKDIRIALQCEGLDLKSK